MCKLRTTSIALEREPALRPLMQTHGHGQARTWAGRWRRQSPQAPGEQPQAPREQPPALGDGEGGSALATFAAEHKEEFQAVIDTRKDALKAKLEYVKSCSSHPVTHAQWNVWMDEHWEQFREDMRVKPKERRAGSQRVFARADIARPAPRIQPSGVRWTPPKLSWAHILWGREGWHGLKVDTGRIITVYLHQCFWHTWYIDCSKFRVHGADFQFRQEFEVLFRGKSLQHLWEQLQDVHVRGIYEFAITGMHAPGTGPVLKVAAMIPIEKPLPRAAKRRRASEGVHGDGSGEGGSDAGARASDVTQSDASVDTDIDTDVGSGSSDTGEKPPKPKPGPPPAPPPPEGLLEEPPVAPEEDAEPNEEVQVRKERQPANTIWQSMWYFITAVPGQPDMRIRMRSTWKPLMGKVDMSKNTRIGFAGPPNCKISLKQVYSKRI